MCGIWAIFGVETTNYEKYERAFHQIRHRGPDALRFQYENEIEVIETKKIIYIYVRIMSP